MKPLINEKQSESFKPSDGNPWMHCLKIRAEFFVLMLIVIGIGFSDQAFPKKTLESSSKYSKLIERANNQSDDFFRRIVNAISYEKFREAHQVKESRKLDFSEANLELLNETADLKKSSISQNRYFDICNERTVCKLTCSIFLEEDRLNTRLESQQKKCKKEMELVIQASIFSQNKLSRNFLSGNFKIRSLTLYHNILYEIADNAFNKTALKNLTTLIITNPTITKMNEKTFAGLNAIKYFEMTNQESLSPLKAAQFLKPMSKTLTELFVMHSSVLKTYDTTPWFNGTLFKKLVNVDLSGNYFLDTLNASSFTNLVRVESLRLRNCRIKYFAENTFSKVINTLRFLDLSQNQLKTLNVEFLLSVSGTSVHVSLSRNYWDCSCDNNDFVEAIKNNKIIFLEEPKCSSPYRYYGVDVKNVKNCCENENEICAEEIETTESAVTETVMVMERN